MKIAVIGMGKIGLPLAVQYARKGHDVIGVDINSNTVNLINKGLEPFPEEAQLQEYLYEVIQSQHLRATLSYEEAVSDADVTVVVVPLFVNEHAEPDFTTIDSATKNIGKNLKKNSLVCYETTLPIGTTRKRLTPSLEQESHLKVGKDFAVVFSPERVFTGRIFQDLRKYPKIVGGITENCTQRGVAFYEKVLDFDERKDLTKPNGVWKVASTESAEFTKLAETTYRDVNIALANQFAIHADELGVNIYEIIEAANSQKYSNIHQPGISVGGHCIPVYPRFYLWNDEKATLVKNSRIINEEMPSYVIKKIVNKIGNIKELNFLILGISYRENVKESAFSGIFDLVKELTKQGAKMFAMDPLYSENEIIELNLNPFKDNFGQIDVIILHTSLKDFATLNFEKFPNCKLIYDGRNFYASENIELKKSIMTLGRGEINGN